MRRTLFRLCSLAAFSQPALGVSSDKKVEILFLSAYHMSNPGSDLNNFKADDIFQPKRQKELHRLVAALALFRPTRIMIEESAPAPTFSSAYFAAFKAEKLATQGDELLVAN